MEKQRKHYKFEEKVVILRRHLLENEPISKLCDELGLQPTVFYRWQKEFFENEAAAFESKRPTTILLDQERISCLEKKIQTKDEVLAELMAEHVALKKALAGTASRRRTCWLDVSRRSMRSATGSWRRHGNKGRFVASKPLDVQRQSR
jgi:transposase